jgi:hypothetical protein
MTEQTIHWYSTKEDGNPKGFINGGFVFVVKDKRSMYYYLKCGSYNGNTGNWFEFVSSLHSEKIDQTVYDVLYYTSDLNYINIYYFFNPVNKESGFKDV